MNVARLASVRWVLSDLWWMSIVPYLAINHRSYLCCAAQPYITGARQFPTAALSQAKSRERVEGGKRRLVESREEDRSRRVEREGRSVGRKVRDRKEGRKAGRKVRIGLEGGK